MRKFTEILAIAVGRKGSIAAVEVSIPAPLSPENLSAVPGDRWLSQMTQNIFRAGFNRQVINSKWPAFEEAFAGFDPERCAKMSDDWFDDLLRDTRIVRNGARIQSVRRNAVLVLDTIKRHGSFGRFLAGHGPHQFAQLLEHLHRHGDRLGDKTAQYFLREAGVDSYVLSDDVIQRLSIEGVADKVPTSTRARQTIQQAFDVWQSESGQSLTYISKVLAMSVESPRVSRFHRTPA